MFDIRTEIQLTMVIRTNEYFTFIGVFVNLREPDIYRLQRSLIGVRAVVAVIVN